MRDLCKELLEMVRTELKAIVRETMLEVLQDEKRKSVYPERVSIVQASEITGYSKNSLTRCTPREKSRERIRWAAN